MILITKIADTGSNGHINTKPMRENEVGNFSERVCSPFFPVGENYVRYNDWNDIV
jgi:hypothetical protein